MRIPGVIFESVYIDTLHVLDLGVSLHCEVRYLVPVCKALANNVQPSQVDLRCHGCAPVALVCRIIPGWQSMLHRRGVYNGAQSRTQFLCTFV